MDVTPSTAPVNRPRSPERSSFAAAYSLAKLVLLPEIVETVARQIGRALGLVGFLREPRTRHAQVAHAVARVVLALGVHVLGLRLVVLQRGEGPDRVLTRREELDHRLLAVALQAVSKLVPAGDSLVVATTHRELAVWHRAHHALRDARAAVHRERGRVDHHVPDLFVLAGALDD